MWRVVSILLFVAILAAPAPVSNQSAHSTFDPWAGKDAPVPLQWYCLDPAPHAFVYRTEYCEGRWIGNKCQSGQRVVGHDPESPMRVCGWFMFFTALRR